MNISRASLYRIVVEEYAKEEGLQLSEDKADELLKYIKGGPKPDWMDDDREIPEPPELPPAPESEPRADDTMPFPADDMPQYDDEDVNVGGAYDPDAEAEISGAPVGGDMSDEEIVASISQMIQGRDPEHVSELFQAVFAQIPGVEMGPAEEEPETLYTPGAEGRPQMGFKLENLMELIREVISEGHYHDMGGEGEIYNALDPHGFENMSDAELIDMMHTDGMEEMIVLDGEGDLANREEGIAALQDV